MANDFEVKKLLQQEEAKLRLRDMQNVNFKSVLNTHQMRNPLSFGNWVNQGSLRGAPVRLQNQWKNMPYATKIANRMIYPDRDGDRVPNRWDCQPRNKYRQDTGQRNMTPIEKKHLQRQFGQDDTFDYNAEVDPSLSYYENKRILGEKMYSSGTEPMSQKEYDASNAANEAYYASQDEKGLRDYESRMDRKEQNEPKTMSDIEYESQLSDYDQSQKLRVVENTGEKFEDKISDMANLKIKSPKDDRPTPTIMYDKLAGPEEPSLFEKGKRWLKYGSERVGKNVKESFSREGFSRAKESIATSFSPGQTYISETRDKKGRVVAKETRIENVGAARQLGYDLGELGAKTQRGFGFGSTYGESAQKVNTLLGYNQWQQAGGFFGGQEVVGYDRYGREIRRRSTPESKINALTGVGTGGGIYNVLGMKNPNSSTYKGRDVEHRRKYMRDYMAYKRRTDIRYRQKRK